MSVRGIRGATTVVENDSRLIVEATGELLQYLISSNDISYEDIVSIFFTVTDDLTAEFPAVAARELGMIDVPLLCTREIPVISALQSCIRVLMHVNSVKSQKDIKHVYLRDAKKLRPDL